MKVIICPHCERQISYLQFLKNLRACPLCQKPIDRVEETDIVGLSDMTMEEIRKCGKHEG